MILFNNLKGHGVNRVFMRFVGVITIADYLKINQYN